MTVESLHQELIAKPDMDSLQAWMVLGFPDIGGFDLVSEKDLQQRFSLGVYVRMHEAEGISRDELESRFAADAVTYVEEYVLRVKLGQRELELRDHDLFSSKFGSKSVLSMCKDAVVAREKKNIDPIRAKHEGLGISNLVKLLEVTRPGEVVVIVSPPDPGDKNMAGYTMVYLYEKQDNGKIWFGAVRDEGRGIGDWQKFAAETSLWQEDWGDYDHLKFVALPYVAKNSLGEVLNKLGVTSDPDDIPLWIRREAQTSAKLIAANIEVGNKVMAQRVLDAFKTAVIAGRDKTEVGEHGYSVARMTMDPRYLMMVQRFFDIGGGGRFIAAGGICGIDEINSLTGEPMNNNNALSDVMGIDERKTTKTSSSESTGMHCGACCGSHVAKEGDMYVCKDCGASIECAKVDKPAGP